MFPVGYHIENLAKAEINVIPCSPLFQKLSHLILEDNEFGNDLLLVNLFCLFQILFSMCLEILQTTCPIIFPGTEVRLTGMDFPRSSFWSS